MRLAALGIVFEVNIVMLERVLQALDEQQTLIFHPYAN